MTSNFYFKCTVIHIGDRGFTCDDVLAQKGARLIIPPFLPSGGDALSREDEYLTKIIAIARSHIERYGNSRD